jgi:hypothetical protein
MSMQQLSHRGPCPDATAGGRRNGPDHRAPGMPPSRHWICRLDHRSADLPPTARRRSFRASCRERDAGLYLSGGGDLQ